jgi:hypothetical protein
MDKPMDLGRPGLDSFGISEEHKVLLQIFIDP